MSTSISSLDIASNAYSMMGTHGILTYYPDLLPVMCNTNAFFAGGACLTLAKAAVTGKEQKFDTKGDLDIWVPCFIPDSVAAHHYNQLALESFKREFEKCSLFMDKKPVGADPFYRFDVCNKKDAKCSYKIWRVDTYVHAEGNQKVQVIGVHSLQDSLLLTPLQIVAGFDISICRCFVMPTDVRRVHAPSGVFEEIKRGIFGLLPLNDLHNLDRTAERVAKYYGRGFVMEESVGCPTCNHSSVRALTEDEAIAYVAGSTPCVPPTPIKTPILKNTLNVVEQGAPVKPEPPRLVLLDTAMNVSKKLFEDNANKFAVYYKDLTPLLGEKVINVNLERDSRITTVHLFESVLRKALSNIVPQNKGVGRHLMFWRGTTQFADYITDMVFDMIMEMSMKYE